MRHTPLTIVELLGYAVMWSIVAAAWIGAFSGNHDMGIVGAAIFTAVLLAFAHVPDTGLSYYTAKKGLHPKSPPPQGNA